MRTQLSNEKTLQDRASSVQDVPSDELSEIFAVVSLDDSALIASGSGEETANTCSSGRKKTIKLSDDDVVSNSILMLLAGYETTSSGLATTFHLLAKHPDIQEKLRREIIEAIDEDESHDSLYTKVMNLKYLDLCIRESLRLFPPVTG